MEEAATAIGYLFIIAILLILASALAITIIDIIQKKIKDRKKREK